MSLKSIFFTSDDTDKVPKNDVKSKEAAPVAQPQPQPVYQPSPTISNLTGVVDNNFKEMLENVIEENKVKGIDYLDFMKSVASMASMPVDERTKFNTVLNILSGQGCTVDSLLMSVDSHIRRIQEEQAVFESDLEREYTSTVVSKTQRLDTLKKHLEEISADMIKTNEEISVLSKEKMEDENRLAVADTNFKKTVSFKITELTDDRNKISTYLQK